MAHASQQQPANSPVLSRAGVTLLAFYSAALIGIELATSQEFVRHFVTDITGPVPFYAVNTTLSVFLLWAASLLFLNAAGIGVRPDDDRPATWWLVSQFLVFAWLGCDDRFLFHETAAFWLGIGDHYVLASVGALEGLLLAFAWSRNWLTRPVILSLGIAGVLFVLMLGVDAKAPHDLRLRLSIEDAAKTCACFFFLKFAWQMHTERIAHATRDAAETAVLQAHFEHRRATEESADLLQEVG